MRRATIVLGLISAMVGIGVMVLAASGGFGPPEDRTPPRAAADAPLYDLTDDQAFALAEGALWCRMFVLADDDQLQYRHGDRSQMGYLLDLAQAGRDQGHAGLHPAASDLWYALDADMNGEGLDQIGYDAAAAQIARECADVSARMGATFDHEWTVPG